MPRRTFSFRFAALLCVTLLATAGMRPVVAYACAAMGMTTHAADRPHACCGDHCLHGSAEEAGAPGLDVATCCTASPPGMADDALAVAAPEGPRSDDDVRALLPERSMRTRAAALGRTPADIEAPPPVRLHLAFSILLT